MCRPFHFTYTFFFVCVFHIACDFVKTLLDITQSSVARECYKNVHD